MSVETEHVPVIVVDGHTLTPEQVIIVRSAVTGIIVTPGPVPDRGVVSKAEPEPMGARHPPPCR